MPAIPKPLGYDESSRYVDSPDGALQRVVQQQVRAGRTSAKIGMLNVECSVLNVE